MAVGCDWILGMVVAGSLSFWWLVACFVSEKR